MKPRIQTTTGPSSPSPPVRPIPSTIRSSGFAQYPLQSADRRQPAALTRSAEVQFARRRTRLAHPATATPPCGRSGRHAPIRTRDPFQSGDSGMDRRRCRDPSEEIALIFATGLVSLGRSCCSSGSWGHSFLPRRDRFQLLLVGNLLLILPDPEFRLSATPNWRFSSSSPSSCNGASGNFITASG